MERKYKRNCRGLEQQFLILKVNPPNSPNPGTERLPRTPQVTVSVRYPDGTEEIISGRAGKMPQRNGDDVAAEYEARMQQLEQQNDLPKYGEDGKTIIGYGGVLGTTVADAGISDTTITGVTTQLHGAASEQEPLGKFAEANFENMKVSLKPGSSKTFTFELTDAGMVNIWMPGNIGKAIGPWLNITDIPNANFSMHLSGGPENVNIYTGRSSESAETISSVLPAGIYSLTVSDSTSYPFNGDGFDPTIESISLPSAPLSLKVQKYNTANIEGRISLDGNVNVMPVSMGVATFKSNGEREKDVSKIPQLDPSKPVWVIFHGRTDNPDSNNMKELQRRFFDLAGEDYQVVYVDWEKAANDVIRILGKDIGDLEDAEWTPAVGRWVGQQLLAAGISPANARFGGHSHGTFVGYFAAEWMQQEWKKLHPSESGKVGAIVALDSAKNPVFFGADIPEGSIVFSNVAERSIAFHSSILGSRNRAFGADRAVTVTSSHIDPFKEHGFAVSMFADMLADMKTGKNQRITPFFRLSREKGISLDGLPDAEGYDAWIEVRTEMVNTPDGPWWKAQASTLRFRNADGSWSTPLFDPEIENENESLPPSSGPGSYLP